MVAMLAAAPRMAAAQSNSAFGSSPFDNFAGGTVRSLEHRFQADLYVLGAFDGRRSVDRFDRAEVERPQPWMFYGRLGPMYFQNQMDAPTQGTQFSWRRTGPGLGGRVYIGIHRTFH
jgi:hypothetical protein